MSTKKEIHTGGDQKLRGRRVYDGSPGDLRIKGEARQQADFAGTRSNETAKRM